MGESLYAILGVEEDADREAIKDAYRDRAKDAHPDVSDASDATRQFKRLTVARDTLLDDAQRARYDDLGHDAYVRQHDRTDLFDITVDTALGTHSQRASGPVSAARTVADGDGTGGDWWRKRAGPDPKPAGGSSNPKTQSRSGGSATWARSQSTETTETGPSNRGVLSFVREAGIWVILHVLLVCSAVATAIFLYVSVGPTFVGPAIVFGFVIVVAAITASTFHLVSIVYT